MPVFDEAWGEAFTRAMRAHMDQLYESVYAEGDDFAEPVTVTDQPFCGCEDCDERERYTLAMILIAEGLESGRVRMEERQ